MSMRLKTGIKSRLTEPFQSFAPNTHKLCILKYCINILFILQKNHFYPSTFILNDKIIQLSLDCSLWYFLTTESELDLPLGYQSPAGDIWQGTRKAIISVIDNIYPANVIWLIKYKKCRINKFNVYRLELKSITNLWCRTRTYPF